MPAGQPPKYKTPEELQSAMDSYFTECEAKDNFPNVAGMTVHLGFADPQSLIDQEVRGEQYSWIIKRAKRKMWDGKFQAACKGQINSTIFIFDSINNHGLINNRAESKSEHTGADGGPIEYRSKTDEELDRRIRELTSGSSTTDE
jgi:hypothetical protein